jgi:hypothetical protein
MPPQAGSIRIKAVKQPLEGTGTGKLLPKQPDRFGIRYRVLKPKTQAAHEGAPVPNLEIGAIV